MLVILFKSWVICWTFFKIRWHLQILHKLPLFWGTWKSWHTSTVICKGDGLPSTMRWKWIISTIWLPILKCWFLSDNLTDCTNNKPLYLCLFVSASSNSLLPILFRVKNNQILGTDQAKSQIQSWDQICTLVFQDPYLEKSWWLMFVLSYSRNHISIPKRRLTPSETTERVAAQNTWRALERFRQKREVLFRLWLGPGVWYNILSSNQAI